MSESDLVRVDEIAAELGYHRDTLFGWISRGWLDPHSVRGKRGRFVSRAQLLQVISKADFRSKPRASRIAR